MNKMVVFFVEGETEVKFYQRLVAYYRDKCGGRLNCQVLKPMNVGGVSKYKSRVVRIFQNSVISKYRGSDYEYHVFLCYDSDVFEFNPKPPVDWDIVVNDLIKSGAARVVQVRAVHSIEDWFLYDTEGLRKFLHRRGKIQKKGCSGQKYLAKLFREADRVYIKGSACDELIKALDMSVIISHIGSEIKEIEDEFKPEDHPECSDPQTEAPQTADSHK